jgi:3-hydroxyisobutyrate dehydrogenase-like beta-hydroxyacid dehydrogenase
MDVGFLGLGAMGAAMVPNLVRAGHRVSVWNRNPAAARALEGVRVLSSPGAAFESEAVITMLANDDAVRSVVLGSRALDGAREGCVHVMMSTISPALSGELRDAHRDAGVAYVAAPVLGLPAVAARGELSIMAAGGAAGVTTVQPLLDALGQRTWQLGEDPRRANVAKIAGNMMIMMVIEALGEAVALTEGYGLGAGDFFGIVTSTIFDNPTYKSYAGKIASGSYEPAFSLVLGLKDVNLALDAARAANAELPAAEVVRANILTAIEQGLGSKDWSAFAEVARRRTSTAGGRVPDGVHRPAAEARLDDHGPG